ncbi:MAG: O-methyltransferase [Chitinophagaceae bacterium]|nr:MAG: O-methyltransferase [Chitinophagaceae bacterium]
MSDAIPDSLHLYAEKFSSKETRLLRKINRETNTQVPQANMLSGHLQGRFLSMISKMIKPAVILEIGTFVGYSALCLAEGLQENGILYTIDKNDELEERCRRYFHEAGMDKKIKLHQGNALDIIPAIPGPFDLVFIDADKPNYAAYFDLVIDKVRQGGILLADNVLYHGEILLPEDKQSHNAKAIAAFNKKISEDPRIDEVMLTMRDGLFLMMKK